MEWVLLSCRRNSSSRWRCSSLVGSSDFQIDEDIVVFERDEFLKLLDPLEIRIQIIVGDSFQEEGFGDAQGGPAEGLLIHVFKFVAPQLLSDAPGVVQDVAEDVLDLGLRLSLVRCERVLEFDEGVDSKPDQGRSAGEALDNFGRRTDVWPVSARFAHGVNPVRGSISKNRRGLYRECPCEQERGRN